MDDERRHALERLKTASPLETPGILQQMELYDRKSSQEIIDEVYREFEGSQNKVENIVIPVFTSIADGFFRKSSLGDSLRKKGMTTTRIVEECRSFSYDSSVDTVNPELYSETEKNRIIREATDGIPDINGRVGSDVTQEYDRKGNYTDQREMNRYRDDQFGDNKTMRDEYSGEIIYRTKKNPDRRRNDPKGQYAAELDHIVPLQKVHGQMKSHCLLTDDDIKKLANDSSNYAMTSRRINNKKRSDENKDFVKSPKADDLELDDDTRKNMEYMGKVAQKNLEKNANHMVFEKLMDRDEEKRKEWGEQMISNAGSGLETAGDLAIGTLVIEIMKPLFFEMKDCVVNGITAPIEGNDLMAALAFRMKRVKTYVFSKLDSVGMNSIGDLIKTIVSSLVRGIADLFFGIVKNMFRLVKEGITIAISAVKILATKGMSAAQKGDAVVKLVGSAVIGVLGTLLIEKINLSEPFETIVEALVCGCGVLFFMVIMDKIDLFSAKAEKRRDRIIEIFDERIKDIQETAGALDEVAIEKLRNQSLEFNSISESINSGLESDNIDSINDGLYRMAEFMGVKLPYLNTDEFIKWMDSNPALTF